MAAMNFSTANQTLRQILGNGLTYTVPRFQRDYSWTQDEWDDLWQDIQGSVSDGGEPAHYMGYLVLQTRDNKQFEIIDGQQRLTTLSLLALAVIAGLDALVAAGTEPDNNRQRAQQLRGTFIGYLDPVPLVPQKNWPQFDPDPMSETAYRLGNLTLLESDLNRKIGNAAFAEEREAFAKSTFDLTRRIAQENAEWTIDRLAHRQRWMAQQAAAIWRIGQLDNRGPTA